MRADGSASGLDAGNARHKIEAAVEGDDLSQPSAKSRRDESQR